MVRSYSGSSQSGREVKARPKSSPNLSHIKISTPDILLAGGGGGGGAGGERSRKKRKSSDGNYSDINKEIYFYQ